MNSRGTTIAVVTATAAAALSGCGYRMGVTHDDVVAGATPVTATVAASVNIATAVPPAVAGAATVPARAVPPNAQGDPACASPLAWGRQPQGRGVIVSVWSQTSTAVTVLVRTRTGVDVAERAALERNDLRLFEFPDVGYDAVSEVLIMTNAARCFAVPDPVTFR